MPSTRQAISTLYKAARICICGPPLRVYRSRESLNELTPSRCYKGEGGGAKYSPGNAKSTPLERRHNVLRARPGLIRKCLTLVKPGPDCPDIPLHDTPGNPYQTTTIATPAVTALCDHSHEYILICAGYVTSVVSFVTFIIRNIYACQRMIVSKWTLTNSESISLENFEAENFVMVVGSSQSLKFLTRVCAVK